MEAFTVCQPVTGLFFLLLLLLLLAATSPPALLRVTVIAPPGEWNTLGCISPLLLGLVS